jgi:Fe2+ transport system protein FeoA
MPTVAVNRCRPGDSGKIVELATRDRTILAKLMSLGIVPGAQIRVLRCQPGILLQLGHTKVALDRYLASHVVVERK